jgi:predicted phage terminase large subunit-like protein
MIERKETAQLRTATRNDFYTFIQRCFNTLHPGIPFLDNWHLEAVAYLLRLVQAGLIRRLIINLPPRHLKSLMASVALPAFALGDDPSKRIVCLSHSLDLATNFSNQTREIMRQPWYQMAFPRTRISRTKDTEAEFRTTQQGYRMATSVGGSLTGRGANLIIVDDPLKAQDALSDPIREQVNSWFANTLLSRLDDKRHDAIVVVMQRLHVDDLAGSLLRNSHDWTVLNLPAVAECRQTFQIDERRFHTREVDDVLHPEREPRSVLEDIRKSIGSDNFMTQYQQSPAPPGGNLIKRAWLKRYEAPPARSPSTLVLQSFDTASKAGEDNSWTVGTTWYVNGNCYYLIDVYRRRCDYPTLKKDAVSLYRGYEPSIILIEEAGSGNALITELRDQGLPTVAIRPTTTKLDRMSVQSAKFESGQVVFPTDAPWLGELEAELLAFPHSRFSDQVDSISQALGHQRPPVSLFSDKSLARYSRLLDGLAADSFFGRLAGRPW